jgi:AcrR family transcriptional regulator
MRRSSYANPSTVADTRLIPAAFDAMGQEGRILRATMECIVELGIDRATTRAIARRADLKQGIIHYYFKNKDELLMRLLSVIFAESELIMAQIALSDAPARTKVELILEAGRRFVVERHEVFIVYVAFWAHAMARGGRWKLAYNVLLDRLIGAIRAVIEFGERSGDFQKGMAGPAAALLVACVQGLGLQANMRSGIRQACDIQASFDAVLALFARGTNAARVAKRSPADGRNTRRQPGWPMTAKRGARGRGAKPESPP